MFGQSVFGASSYGAAAGSTGAMAYFQVAGLAPLGPGTPTVSLFSLLGLVGVNTVGIGRPIVFRYLPPPSSPLQVDGFSLTGFGTPSLMWPTDLVAAGVWTSRFGTPAVEPLLAAGGFGLTGFGTLALQARFGTAGFGATGLGTPSVSRALSAPRVHSSRFGKPSMVIGSSLFTAGFCTTGLGAMSVQPLLRAASRAPGCRFGTTTLKRSTTC